MRNASSLKQSVFLYSDNSFIDLNPPNAISPQIDINDKGQVYIFYGDHNAVLHMVKYDQGVYTRIDPPQEVSGTSRSVFVNNKGQVVGKYDSGANLSTFLYNKGIYTLLNLPHALTAGDLLAFNDNGQIIGSYSENHMYRTFVANPLDTFEPASQTLHLNNVLVNGNMHHDITAILKQYSVIRIASSVTKGSIATEVTNPVDTFDPATNILTLNAVVVDNMQYNQVVMKLADYQLR